MGLQSRECMIVKFDFHTHTSYSDGEGRATDVVEAAEARGLEAVALTDHGPEHEFGTLAGKLMHLLQDIELARENAGIVVLKGMETNVVDRSGNIDLDEESTKKLDLLVAGIHKLEGVTGDQAGVARAYAEAATNVIQRQRVDVFAHPFYFNGYLIPHLPLEEIEGFVSLAAERGVAIELNLKYRVPERDFLELCMREGVKFSIGTDAHKLAEVGKVDWMLSTLKQVGAKREDLILDRI